MPSFPSSFLSSYLKAGLFFLVSLVGFSLSIFIVPPSPSTSVPGLHPECPAAPFPVARLLEEGRSVASGGRGLPV